MTSEDENDDLIAVPSTSLLIGNTKSGKTHLLKCLIAKHSHRFNYGVVFSSTCFNGDYSYLPDEYVYQEFNVEIIKAIMEIQQKFVDEHTINPKSPIPECFIILDDQIGLVNFNAKNNIFDILFSKARHLHISVFLSIQKCSYLSPAIRENATYVFITRVKNGSIPMLYDISDGFKNEDELHKYLQENCRDYKVVMFNNDESYENFTKIIRAPENIPKFKLKY